MSIGVKGFTALIAAQEAQRSAFEKKVLLMDERQLRELLAHPDTHSEEHIFLQRCLKKIDDERELALRQEEHSRREREVRAAERAAESAEKSALWARLAGAISLAALIISAWPYFPK